MSEINSDLDKARIAINTLNARLQVAADEIHRLTETNLVLRSELLQLRQPASETDVTEADVTEAETEES